MNRKIGAFLVSLAILYGGVLLIYRALLPVSKLRSVHSRIRNIHIDELSGSKGKITYAIAFDVDVWNTRHGINLGAGVTSKDEQIYQVLDTATFYNITVDPTVTPRESLTLGVRSLTTNGKKIFQEPTLPAIIFGSILLLFGLVILYFTFFRSQRNGS